MQPVIAFIEKAVGKSTIINGQPFHLADMKEIWADINKARRLFGWSSLVTSEEGIQRTVKSHLANSAWLTSACAQTLASNG